MPARSPLLESCIETLIHGLEHYTRSNIAKDRKFAILHIDQAVELALKEKVRSLGLSIYKRDGKTTIGPQEAYEILEGRKCVIKEKANLEMLHDERNLIQHKYSNPDESTTKFHIENSLSFFERFLYEEFNIRIESAIPQEVLKDHKLGFTTELTKVDRLLKSAEDSIKSDTSSSIVALFNATEVLIRERLEDMDIDTTSKTAAKIFEVALKRKLLNKEEFLRIHDLRILRNKSIHAANFTPNSKECEEMLNFLQKLSKKMRKK